MFTSPPEQTLEWSDSGVEGSNRFLRRLWSLCAKYQASVLRGLSNPQSDWSNAPSDIKKLRVEMHSLLKQADYDYQRIQYNTVVSACMKMLNAVDDSNFDDSHLSEAALAEALGILLRVLYPVVPHITWQLWVELGFSVSYGDLLDAPWPEVDESALVTDELELVLQVNGKLRGSLSVARTATKEQIEQLALGHEAVVKHLEGRSAKRMTWAPSCWAKCSPRSWVRLATVMLMGDLPAKWVAQSSIISPAPTNSTWILLRSSNNWLAKRTEAADMLMLWAPISVELRTCLATANERWNIWCKVEPKTPTSRATRTASFICPKICGSPKTMESKPLATRNA
jgi:leucyl-tRNA synthetase